MGAAVGGVPEAARALASGGVVVFPTETVYGVGARLDRSSGIDEIFRLKGRERDRPLQVLVSSLEAVETVAEPTADLERLTPFLPGPLTVILRARPHLPDLGAADGTVGVRIPDHPVALELLEAAGPMAATSANRSGEPTPASIVGVRAVFGETVDVYLDGEPSPRGVPSTVISLVGGRPLLLREGAVRRPAVEDALGEEVAEA